MSAVLTVVFTGLCALVADGDGGSGQMLLVDAPSLGSVGGHILPEHAPTLVASLGVLANADSSKPDRVVSVGGEQIGLWDLKGSEVRIRMVGHEDSGLEFFKPERGAASWPLPPARVNDPADWRDMRFIADMKALVGDGRIDPALLAPNTLPNGVAARVHMGMGRLEAGMPSREAFRNKLFEFKGTGEREGLRQAVTDTIAWTVEATAPTIVEIAPVSGGPIKKLLITPGASPTSIFVSNLPAENGHSHHGFGGDDLEALHFAAYYKLLRHQPVDIPQVVSGVASSAPKGTGGNGPLFCPPARFHRH